MVPAITPSYILQKKESIFSCGVSTKVHFLNGLNMACGGIRIGGGNYGWMRRATIVLSKRFSIGNEKLRHLGNVS
jgi:hypothetical protein